MIMPETLFLVHEFNVLMCGPNGEIIQDERAAVDLIGEALGQHAEVVVIPAERLGDAFFRLRTGVAGDIMQKFVTHRLLLVIMGDISRYVAESSALRDFVGETNQGDHVWFLSSREELDKRLAQRSGA
jgi:hypothetical protein